MNYSPPKVILLFFLLIVFAGSLLLSLPAARTAGHGFSYLASLFTATSAVCVTGLAVVDIGTYYTLFGQIVILLLVQIGGLGYMTLSTIVGLFIGKIALKERAMLKELLDVGSFAGILSLLKRIVAIVLVIEAAGAAILTVLFMRRYPFWTAAYHGIFNSVSSFCNAGLSLFPNSLEGYAANAPMLLTVSLLVILGGIGFLVLIELGGMLKDSGKKLSVHTRIVLIMTAVLLVAGTACIGAAEAHNTLAGRGAAFGLLNSFFQSVMTRSGGFNSIAIGACENTTAIVMSVLMFIGASPGGTGGGIKTTTFVLVLLFVGMVIEERESATLFRRRIPREIVQKALAVFILALFLVVIVMALLAGTERHLLIDLFFEVASASGTVGLSRGITPLLTPFGKIIIILTMIIGRVGPLVFLLALLKTPREPGEFKYPEEKILVG